jgi:hypothetical protein
MSVFPPKTEHVCDVSALTSERQPQIQSYLHNCAFDTSLLSSQFYVPLT